MTNRDVQVPCPQCSRERDYARWAGKKITNEVSKYYTKKLCPICKNKRRVSLVQYHVALKNFRTAFEIERVSG